MTIAASYDALARMLDYPLDKERLQTDYNLVSDFLNKQRLDSSISSFAEFAAASSLAALQEEYVATFDFNPATAPYLGHHLFGDNQKKGGYMIMLKQEFERRGYIPAGVELPDHLSVRARISGTSGTAGGKWRGGWGAAAVHRRVRAAGSGTAACRLCRPAGVPLEGAG